MNKEIRNPYYEDHQIVKALREKKEKGDGDSFSLGWKRMDAVVKIAKGQLSIITGIPSSGKSNWLDAVMVNMANEYKWRFLIFAPESQPIGDHAENLVTKKYNMPLRGLWQGIPNIPDNEIIKTGEPFTASFKIVSNLSEYRQLDRLLHLFEHTAIQMPVDAFVIDPFNELEHNRPINMTETEYLNVTLGKMKTLAIELDVHIFIVAHPTKMHNDKKSDDSTPVVKPYDISGSAAWYNKADNIFSVWRDMKDDVLRTTVAVQKVRRRRLGKVGSVEFEYIPSTAGYK